MSGIYGEITDTNVDNSNMPTYTSDYIANNPTPMSMQQQEDEKKKQNVNTRIAAIGDTMSAIANLYYTTQGAPAMQQAPSMSGKMRERYDKINAERKNDNKTYYEGLMRAKQLDKSDANNERAWRRQLGLDARDEKRYNESIEHRNKREEKEDAYKDRAFDQSVKAFDQSVKTQDNASKLNWAQFNQSVKAQNDNTELRKMQIAANGQRALRGKALGFTDGSGNQVSIYDNVWRNSMQQVFDAIMESQYPDEKNRKTMSMRYKDYKSKDDFVKQNWSKYPSSRQLMLAFSKIDPATMTSATEDDNVDAPKWIDDDSTGGNVSNGKDW